MYRPNKLSRPERLGDVAFDPGDLEGFVLPLLAQLLLVAAVFLAIAVAIDLQ